MSSSGSPSRESRFESPPPHPRHDDLEALIEEARRRARRRRLKVALAALVLLIAIGGGGYAAVALTGGGTRTKGRLPDGFHYVRARGRVSHARIVERAPTHQKVIDISTGAARPAVTVLELWWDTKTGLERVVGHVDGRLQFDLVGQTCMSSVGHSSARFCLPPPPFDLRNQGFTLPVDPRYARVVARGRLNGRAVIWVEGLVVASPNTQAGTPSGQRVALDARTRQPLARRTTAHGRVFDEEEFTVMRDLPDKKVTFAVPDGGAPQGSFPPTPDRSSEAKTSTRRGARQALGMTPLWVGSRFRGHALRSIEVGTDSMKTAGGARLRPASFVRLDYGVFELQEFGRERPFWYEQGPTAGHVLVDPALVALSRKGLLVLVSPKGGRLLDETAAVALAKALRPLPSR